MYLKEIVKIKGGKRLPKGSNLQTTPNSHPYIRVRDMGEKYIQPKGLEYVPDDIFPSIKNYVVNENDVIISIVGTIGLISIIHEELNNASQTENCAKLSGLNKIDAEYLYYYLISDLGQEEIAKATVGAVQPKLPLYGIENINIDWKTKIERENIVSILKSLDDKIQLNTQTNQTLEAIAQAIFKSWFVDFDPVRAKAAALNEGKSEHEANLAAMSVICGKDTSELNGTEYSTLWQIAEAFPSEFGNDGLPMGWKYRYLKDVCNIVYGKGLPKNKLTENGYYVFGANGVIGYYSEYMYEKPQILIGCRGTVGQVTISHPFSFITNNSLVIEYEKSELSLYYIEKYLRGINLKEVSSGSVQPQITIQSMNNVKILIPNKEIHTAFTKKVEGMYKLRQERFYENIHLSKIRDLLLPRLLSGEIEL